jgi:hypothetical protein
MSLPPYDQSMRDFERHYQVVLPDSVGQAALGFRDGSWFRLNSGTPHAVPIRSAIIICPHAAGSIVQIVCWWMRENIRSPRALDLATELALAVGELARKAIEDDPLGMSITTLPSPLPDPSVSAFSPTPGYPGAPTNYPPAGYPEPTPAPSSYLAGAQMSAATTVLPQINPDAPMPSGRGVPGPAFGAGPGAVPRPSGPPPNMPALPGGSGGRGQQGAGGYANPQQYPPRNGGGAPPPYAGGPGQSRYGNGPDGRPSAPPPRRGAPYDQDEPVRQDQSRGDFFRDGAAPPPPRRPAPYGQPEPNWQGERGGERNGERSGEYSRPPQRPRNDPRAW